MRELVRVKRESPSEAAGLAKRLAVSERESGVRVSTNGSEVVVVTEHDFLLALSNVIYYVCKAIGGTFEKLFPRSAIQEQGKGNRASVVDKGHQTRARNDTEQMREAA